MKKTPKSGTPTGKKPQLAQVGTNPLDKLLDSVEPTFDAIYIPEPKLIFGQGRACVDPKTGIDLYGPFGQANAPKQIRIGVVGLGDDINRATVLLQAWKGRIAPGFNSKGKSFDPIAFPFFPGNTQSTGFGCDFTTDANWNRVLRESELQTALDSHGDDRDKLKAVVDVFVNECKSLSQLEQEPQVVLVCLPERLKKIFGPSGALNRSQLRNSTGPSEKKKVSGSAEQSGQMLIPLVFENSQNVDDEIEGYFNLHHALKAQCMTFNFPIQFVWESTLNGDGPTQDPASVAWNFSSAIYYKAGNIPWQIQSMPDNTCFVGISFYQESPHANADMQSSLAQVFGAGDGLVLQGQRAVIDKKRDRKPHLTEEGAFDLLDKAIKLYADVNKTRPKRVVVHKTSRFWAEELSGFKKALTDIYYSDFVAINDMPDVRFMRTGKKPPLRGTVVFLEPRKYLIYTTGYVPFFKEYPGMKTPRPIEVMEHIGDSSASEICKEILSLTKLNWNSCAFANSSPITISFARGVGRILSEFPNGTVPKTKYRFFM